MFLNMKITPIFFSQLNLLSKPWKTKGKLTDQGGGKKLKQFKIFLEKQRSVLFKIQHIAAVADD